MFNTLIAEDNVAFRHSLHRMLTERFPFMQIDEAGDANAVMRQALARRFDLIFMDIRLPLGNGLQLTEAIKAVFVDTVICILTSHDLPEYRDAALRYGADLFMVKGDSTEIEILKMVEHIFGDEIDNHLH
ncbi:MAG: response regulator transcription factor [Thiobacillaceae bacterium]